MRRPTTWGVVGPGRTMSPGAGAVMPGAPGLHVWSENFENPRRQPLPAHAHVASWRYAGITVVHEADMGGGGQARAQLERHGGRGVQGYVEAAEMFQRESGTAPGVDLAAMGERDAIRKAVQGGDVEAAIEAVNDLNPEVRPARVPPSQVCTRVRVWDLSISFSWAFDCRSFKPWGRC